MSEEKLSEKEKNEQQKLREEVNKIYTPLSVAKKEIQRRWKDKELRKKVEDFLKDDLPNIFKNKPKAFLFRYISTPNLEFKMFFDLSKMVDLEPIFVEFLNDKFCTVNWDKLYMGKMVFSKRNRNGDCVISKKIIIDLNESDGLRMSEIKTLWGEKFIDFHHRIFRKYYKKVKTFDAYVLKSNGESPYDVYLKFFSLLICHGVFFEIYYSKNTREQEFISKVIIPAFNKIKNIFGLKPLIVPLIEHTEESIFLQYYPDYLKKEIK